MPYVGIFRSLAVEYNCHCHVFLYTCYRLKMPDKCGAPGCPTNMENKVLPKEKRISVFRFPRDNDATIELRKKWINAVPRTNWMPSDYSALCEKHFIRSDFKQTHTDTNLTRKKEKDGDSLKRKELNDIAVPTQWPGCPTLLSKKPPIPRPTTLTTSVAREEREQIRDEVRTAISARMEEEKQIIDADEEMNRDGFQSLEEFDENYYSTIGTYSSSQRKWMYNAFCYHICRDT